MHDVGAIKALVTEDVRHEDPSAHEPVLRGREALDPYLPTRSSPCRTANPA